MNIHVLPVDDILPHYEDGKCWCDPVTEDVCGSLIIIHNSFDGREYSEPKSLETGTPNLLLPS